MYRSKKITNARHTTHNCTFKVITKHTKQHKYPIHLLPSFVSFSFPDELGEGDTYIRVTSTWYTVSRREKRVGTSD